MKSSKPKKNLVRFPDSDFVIIDFLFQGISVDAEHLSGFNLVSVMRHQCQLDEWLFHLFDDDVVEAVELNLSFFLLLEENLKLTLYKLFKAYGLKIRNKKII